MKRYSVTRLGSNRSGWDVRHLRSVDYTVSYLDPVYTPEKFENAAVFIRLAYRPH